LPCVHAIVLHWRTPRLSARCLHTLRAQVGQDSTFGLRLVLIDNGSGDAPRPESLPGLDFDLIRLPENTGYAGGNNVGLRRAFASGADYAFLVNSDVICAPDCLERLLEVAAARPRAGVLGPLVLREAVPGRIESNGQSFDRVWARHSEHDRGRPADSVDQAPHGVDAVSGCALLASRDLAERVGLLNERFFLYFEDLEWCLRAYDAGFDVMTVPRARVWHAGGASIGPRSARTTLYSVRNHLLVAASRTRWRDGRVVWPLIVAYHAAHLALNPGQWSREHVRALARGTWHAWTGRVGAEP
jgi:GT2 family glycosyltransferase